MKSSLLTTGSVCLACLCTIGAAVAAVDTWPTCDSPQNLGPMLLGASAPVYATPAVARNATDYAVVFPGASGSLAFQRFYADGTPAAPRRTIVTGAGQATVGLAWNGSGYGVIWQGAANGHTAVFFARLDANGAMIGGVVQVSYYGTLQQADAIPGAVAFGANRYAIIWSDTRNGNADVFATMLDQNGVAVVHDVSLTGGTVAGDQTFPTIAWSHSGLFIYAWQDRRSGTHYEIYTGRLSPDGPINTPTFPAVSGAKDSTRPSLADGNGGLGMTWNDTRDGSASEVYFCALTGTYGLKVGNDVRVTNDISSSDYPFIAWTGGEFGIFWIDLRGGARDAWFQRVSATGVLVGSNMPITYGSDVAWVSAAFGNRGYFVATSLPTYSLYVQAWGCRTPYAPPCAGGIDAHGISGTSATVAWLPVDDPYTDVSHFEVWRDGALVGTTSSNSFNDTTLSPGSRSRRAAATSRSAGTTTASRRTACCAGRVRRR